MADCPTCEYHKQRAQIWRDEVYKLVGHPPARLPLPRKENSMTQEEIIELARQAGLIAPSATLQEDRTHDRAIKAFAKLVAEKERKACAKIADELIKNIAWLREEAGLQMAYPIDHPMAKFIMAIKAQAAEKEREACAKLCEDSNTWDLYDPSGFAANLIRARGQA